METIKIYKYDDCTPEEWKEFISLLDSDQAICIAAGCGQSVSQVCTRSIVSAQGNDMRFHANASKIVHNIGSSAQTMRP